MRELKSTAIPLTPVESSQIHSIGHDASTDTLAIRFKDKATGEPRALYYYANVDAARFKEFSEAPSIGSYFYKNIKPNVLEFPYWRVEPAPAVQL